MHASLRQFAALFFVMGAANSFSALPANAETARAIFAGGCFWCLEKDLEHVAGVKSVVSGYTDGKGAKPTYKNRVKGGYRDVVEVSFDPTKTSYEKLLYSYWRSVNPLDAGGQFCDRGHTFTTAIYATSKQQLKRAKASKVALAKSRILKGRIVTPILAAARFFPSEKSHQNYYRKNPARYKFYRYTCRRDATIKKIWGKQAHAGVNHGS
jgi:peptide-methionine (S)-S-oxide reductase